MAVSVVGLGFAIGAIPTIGHPAPLPYPLYPPTSRVLCSHIFCSHVDDLVFDVCL
jgi:hypothetical protein